MVKCRGAFLFLVTPALLFNTFVFRCFFFILLFFDHCLQSLLLCLYTPKMATSICIINAHHPHPELADGCGAFPSFPPCLPRVFFFRALTLSETGLKWFSGVRFFPFSSHQLFRSRGRTREAQIDRSVRTSLQQWQYFFFVSSICSKMGFPGLFLVSRCVASIQNRVRDPIRHSALSE